MTTAEGLKVCWVTDIQELYSPQQSGETRHERCYTKLPVNRITFVNRPAAFLLLHSGHDANCKWLCFHDERHIVHTRIQTLTWPRWKRVSSPAGKETKSPSQACDLTGVWICTSWSFKKNLCHYVVGSPMTDVGSSHLKNEKKTFAGMRQNVFIIIPGRK